MYFSKKLEKAVPALRSLQPKQKHGLPWGKTHVEESESSILLGSFENSNK